MRRRWGTCALQFLALQTAALTGSGHTGGLMSSTTLRLSSCVNEEQRTTACRRGNHESPDDSLTLGLLTDQRRHRLTEFTPLERLVT